MERDPVLFWRRAHAQAREDAELARTDAPSVLPKLAQAVHETWREWRAAIARQEAEAADRPTSSKPGHATAPEGFVAGTLEDQLWDVRRLRKEAEGAGSFTALTGLLNHETELVRAIESRNAELARATRRNMPSEEKISLLVERLRSMPELVQRRLREELGW